VAERQTHPVRHPVATSMLAWPDVDTAVTAAGLVDNQAADRKTAKFMPISEHSIFFSLCQWKTWVHSVLRHWTFWETLVAEFLIFQTMTERFCSSFKESRSRFKAI